MVETTTCELCQMLVFIRHGVLLDFVELSHDSAIRASTMALAVPSLQPMTAIKLYHPADSLLLALYSIHFIDSVAILTALGVHPLKKPRTFF